MPPYATKPIPVMIDGQPYRSISAAARATGRSRQALAQWLGRRSKGLGKPGRPPRVARAEEGRPA